MISRALCPFLKLLGLWWRTYFLAVLISNIVRNINNIFVFSASSWLVFIYSDGDRELIHLIPACFFSVIL